MNRKTKAYIRLMVVFLLVDLAFFIDYMHHGNLSLFLTATAILLVVMLISGRRSIKMQLKTKKRWKMPTTVKIMYGITFAIALVAISTNSLYPSLSVSLFLIAFALMILNIMMVPKKYRPKPMFPFSRLLIAMYTAFLLIISMLSGTSILFFIGVMLGIVSLYSFIRPKKILLAISIVYFVFFELIILSILYLIPLGSSALGFYAWIIINTLAIAYTIMIFRTLSPKKKAKR